MGSNSSTLDSLEDRIVGLAGRLSAATCEWLLLVAEFDQQDGCARWGLTNTAQWLMHRCSISRRTAFEHVRVARALSGSPVLTEQMRAGRLSYSQVRVISRAITADEPRTTEDLVQAAQHCSIGQLEDLVRGLRTADRASGSEYEEPIERVRHGWGADSRWHLSSRLDPERGALVESAIRTVAQAEGISQADALVRIAEIALVELSDSGQHRRRPLRGDERTAVLIHLDSTDVAHLAAATLGSAPKEDQCSPEHSAQAAGSGPAAAAPPGRPRALGRIDRGPGLPGPVAKRLLCDGRLRTVVRDRRGNVRDLGRSRRLVTDRLFRALLLRDGDLCAHPGCTSRAGMQAHHVRHWIDGGRTDLNNLVLLCERHHHAQHDGEFQIIALGHQRFRFVSPDGNDRAAGSTPGETAPRYPSVDSAHVAVATDAATTRWDGARMDRAFAISCFAETRARERHHAAA